MTDRLRGMGVARLLAELVAAHYLGMPVHP